MIIYYGMIPFVLEVKCHASIMETNKASLFLNKSSSKNA